MGVPTSAAHTSSLMLPTMALAMPPPISPTGAGRWVKKLSDSDEAPCQAR